MKDLILLFVLIELIWTYFHAVPTKRKDPRVVDRFQYVVSKWNYNRLYNSQYGW